MPDQPPPTPRRWPIRAGAVAVALATTALMLATGPRLAIVWDEGFTLGREARIRSWFEAMADPPGFAARWAPPDPRSELVQQDPVGPPTRDEVDTRAKLLSTRAIAWFWPFAREEPHGHPPFYAIAGMVGDLVAPGWAPLPRARVGPCLAFGIAAGAIFGFVARGWGARPGGLASGAWALQPNLFGHGHYATVDGVLSCLWVGALLAFARAVDREGRSPRWGWSVAFGVLCGWAADSKLTGWFLPLPFVAWSLLYRDRKGWLTLVSGGAVAVAALYAFNPCWWAEPVSGVERFFRSNLTRGRTIPIPVEFLGRAYDTPRESLPWYNTLAWTAMVTPVGFLTFASVGAGGALAGLRRSLGASGGVRERFAVLAVLHWGLLLALRALPHTPGHDGVRLFLPAFGILAVVAGLGASVVVGRLGRVGRGLILASLAEGAASVGLMMPVPLAYFSPAVGGLPGASKLGMEPTYFWDALTDDALDFLNAHTPPGRTVRFATFPTSWFYLRDTGRLRARLSTPFDPGRPAWYVLQNRPGAFGPVDRELFERGKPAFVVSKQGVPLVLIYPFPEGTTHAGPR